MTGRRSLFGAIADALAWAGAVFLLIVLVIVAGDDLTDLTDIEDEL